MGSRGRESTAVRHESGVSPSFGSVCDIVTPLMHGFKQRFMGRMLQCEQTSCFESEV